MTEERMRLTRRAVVSYAAVLGTGLLTGSTFRNSLAEGHDASAASPATMDATATREKELAELSGLRTQVANSAVCTPAPTETAPLAIATPTEVPLAPTGVPIAYLDIWTLTFLGIAPTPGSDEVHPAGQFMRINLTVAHSSRSAPFLGVSDFILINSKGAISVINLTTNRLLLGYEWAARTQPGNTEARALIFDVPVDSGDSFTLESSEDPTFRVALRVEQRG